VTDRPVRTKSALSAAAHPDARRLHRDILRQVVATGRVPTRATLVGSAVDVDVAAALRELDEVDLLALDDTGEIRAAYPFSPTPTRHRLTLGTGVRVFAMCAVDALGTSAMVGVPVTIASSEPDDGPVVTITVDGADAVWDQPEAVVYRASNECGNRSVDRACRFINFFATEHGAHAWAARHPELTGRVIDRADALAIGVAEFGHLLHDP
jgi:hypothetical protein